MMKRNVKKVVFLVAHDAYLKGAMNIASLLKIDSPLKETWLTTSRKISSSSINCFDMGDIESYEDLIDSDLIVAGLGGRDLNRLISGLEFFKGKERPLVMGYFPGVLHFKIFESLATRLLCDSVLLNCKRDYFLYSRLVKATTGNQNGILFGAPWIGEFGNEATKCDIDFLFVEQSIVPETLSERTALVTKLVGLSVDNPSWKIVVALRARKGEASSHDLKYCIEQIYNQSGIKSSAIEFSVEDIDSLVRRSKRIATISSSVAYTGLACKKSTFFVSDFGVSKTYGNDLFAESGYMFKLSDMKSDSFVSTPWLKDFVQKPRGLQFDEVSRLRTVSASKGIPGFNWFNIKLVWLVLGFCFYFKKNPFVEVNGVVRSIGKINKRIFQL